jgi:hypothetical protein
MKKTISIESKFYKHNQNDIELSFRQALDPNILVVALKKGKDEITTSINKSDILSLIEFFKYKGFE